MRNVKQIIPLILLLLITNGCAPKQAQREFQEKTGVKEVIEEKIAEEENKEVEEETTSGSVADLLVEAPSENTEEEKVVIQHTLEPEVSNDVDVDLTVLSSTMVFSEVLNMMTEPDDYIGKTVRMEGLCAISEDPTIPQTYYACIIKDATACCAQGIEFVLNEEEYTIEDYPRKAETIQVVGTFECYQENGYTYARLTNARLEEG